MSEADDLFAIVRLARQHAFDDRVLRLLLESADEAFARILRLVQLWRERTREWHAGDQRVDACGMAASRMFAYLFMCVCADAPCKNRVVTSGCKV